jgi:hypothetical protein
MLLIWMIFWLVIWFILNFILWKLDNLVHYTPLIHHKPFFWLTFLLFTLAYQFRTEGFTPLWGKYETKDYGGNDIQQFPSIGLNECKQNCIKQKDCKGIVTDYQDDGPGNCWLKNTMENGTENDQRWSYKISRR